MHPTLERQIIRRASGKQTALYRSGPKHLPDWRDYYALIVAHAKVAPDQRALDEINALIREEQRVWTQIACEERGFSDTLHEVQARLEKLREEHVAKIDSGVLPLDAPFSHNHDTIRHDLRCELDCQVEVLRRKIARTRPKAKALLATLVPPIRAAREGMEAAELADSRKWSKTAEFEPSVALRALASAEQDIALFIERVDGIPAENPTRSTFGGWFPPGWLK
jgi:hypothetical protein